MEAIIEKLNKFAGINSNKVDNNTPRSTRKVHNLVMKSLEKPIMHRNRTNNNSRSDIPKINNYLYYRNLAFNYSKNLVADEPKKFLGGRNFKSKSRVELLTK